MLGQELVNAVVLGSMYALTAVGFTLYFGVLNLINLAHGAVYMIGAFIAVTAFRLGLEHGVPIPLLLFAASTLAVGISGVIGMVIERVAVKPLRRAPPLVFLITSIAVYLVLEEAVLLFYPDGGNPQVFPDPFSQRTVLIGNTVVGYVQIFLVSVAVLAIAALHLIITRTNLGRAIRAVTADMIGARMMGIDVDATIARTFFIGSALAAFGGIMEGMNYGAIVFSMGFIAAIKGLTAAVIGGLGNIYGALVGGYLLGITEVLVSAYVPDGSAYKNIFTFSALILFLIFRPNGLLSRDA